MQPNGLREKRMAAPTPTSSKALPNTKFSSGKLACQLPAMLHRKSGLPPTVQSATDAKVATSKAPRGNENFLLDGKTDIQCVGMNINFQNKTEIF
jgi:hypothetical protein